ncbi:glycerol-3-phosphate acyltransferase, partial [Legionella sp.]|uniref:glycerol-3-phosphate acyltransferase n=1 Tax=Legionella sp. TaxID=459 RepID=UPI003CC5208C
IPVLIARIFLTDPMVIGFVALAAVIGHMYPVFFDFQGGKGVATALGALLGLQFIVGVMVIGTWLLVARFTRYSSLASLVSICLSPFYGIMIIGRIEIIPPLFLMAVLIIIKHKDNIIRLIDKTEPKIKLTQRNILEEAMNEPSVVSPIPVVTEVTSVEVATVSEKPTVTKTKKSVKKPAVEKATTTKKPITKKAKPANPKIEK